MLKRQVLKRPSIAVEGLVEVKSVESVCGCLRVTYEVDITSGKMVFVVGILAKTKIDWLLI
jgi:hypothetical protein